LDKEGIMKGSRIMCGECKEGEMVADERVLIGFEIVSDGKGGYEYTGNKKYESPSEEDDIVARCVECGHDTEIWNLKNLQSVDGIVYA
jgi:hypothetical protein